MQLYELFELNGYCISSPKGLLDHPVVKPGVGEFSVLAIKYPPSAGKVGLGTGKTLVPSLFPSVIYSLPKYEPSIKLDVYEKPALAIILLISSFSCIAGLSWSILTVKFQIS